jgi:hypothetical protein
MVIPDKVTFFDLVIEPEGGLQWRALSNGEVIARGVDYLKAIHIALKRVRQAAVQGRAVIRLHGIGEEELKDRLAEEKARWHYPQWWRNCEWHFVRAYQRKSQKEPDLD